jgi:hypothetical protein
MRPAKREEVYKVIDGERDYQDSLWHTDEGHSNPLQPGEFLVLLSVYLRKAQEEWTVEPKPEINTLHAVRKVAGIAVNCLEQHSAPKREGF